MIGEPSVTIRPARAGDLAAVASVCVAALRHDPDAVELPGVLLGDTAGADARTALVAEDCDGTVVGVACGTLRYPPPAVGDRRVLGSVDLLAVDPTATGRGVGRQLLQAIEDRLQQRGATEIRLGGGAPVYLWPGVDPRYTEMTCLAEQAGYCRRGDAVNMTVDLRTAPLDSREDERRLRAAGVRVRRARPAEASAVVDWLDHGPWGGSSWPAEAARALTRDPPACYVAVRDGRYIAFACHSVNRRGWFGPTGTLASERRRGIGGVLLRRCLVDVAATGQVTAQIAWTGPVRFYARAVAARIDRVFWLYGKTPA